MTRKKLGSVGSHRIAERDKKKSLKNRKKNAQPGGEPGLENIETNRDLSLLLRQGASERWKKGYWLVRGKEKKQKGVRGKRAGSSCCTDKLLLTVFRKTYADFGTLELD